MSPTTSEQAPHSSGRVTSDFYGEAISLEEAGFCWHAINTMILSLFMGGLYVG
jgi:hypothetical protein